MINSGVPINDDPMLEHEADIMGNGGVQVPPGLRTVTIAPAPAAPSTTTEPIPEPPPEGGGEPEGGGDDDTGYVI